MRALLLAMVAASALGGILAACVSFDLDGRRYRCDGTPASCGDGWVCGPDGYCAPASSIDARITGEICNNGIDDDGDGLVDCADDECPGQPTCGAGCICTDGRAIEVACMDGIDNDRDGLPDCRDPDCPDVCAGTTTCCPDGSCRVSC